MKKSIVALSLSVGIIFSTLSLSFAEDIGDSTHVTIDGKEYKVQVSDEPTPYGDVAADPVPNMESKSKSLFSKAMVTASDVKRYQITEDPNYLYDYLAHGYVTMKVGSTDAYHYSKAEMWYNNSVYTTSGERWGYGKVWATSAPTSARGTARIFYGQ